MVVTKKGNLNIFSLWMMIIVFNVFLAVGYTFLIGFNNLATTEIMDPIYTTISDMAEDHTSVQMQNYIDQSYTDYLDVFINWDLIMFGIMINFYFFILYSAIQMKKANPFVFFSMVTIGSIFLLLLISVSIDVQQWILAEIYGDVFEDLTYSTPIMDWVFTNMGMVAFILAMIVLLVNQFDRLKRLFLGGEEI